MKKIIFFIALAMVAVTSANAQKQQGGEKNIELQFTPFNTGGGPIGMNGIRFRMFNSESSAIRIGFGISGTNDVTVREQQVAVDGSDDNDDLDVILPELYDTKKSFNFSIRPGYEKHFAGTDRLSPYVGGEIVFALGNETLEKEFHNAGNPIDEEDVKPESWTTFTVTRKWGTSTFGINAVAGCDFYFADNIYMGVEMGFGFQTKKYKDATSEVSNSDAFKNSHGGHDGIIPGDYTGDDAQGDSDFNDQVHLNEDGTKVVFDVIKGDGSGAFKNSGWGPNVQTTIRLGWLF